MAAKTVGRRVGRPPAGPHDGEKVKEAEQRLVDALLARNQAAPHAPRPSSSRPE